MSHTTRPDSELALRERLLAVGGEIVLLSPNAAELPQLLERYTEAFSKWYEAAGLNPQGSPGITIAENPTQILESVQATHDAVLRHASEAKALTAADLKSVRSKGKGILAYVDTLPKRVSLINPRKG